MGTQLWCALFLFAVAGSKIPLLVKNSELHQVLVLGQLSGRHEVHL